LPDPSSARLAYRELLLARIEEQCIHFTGKDGTDSRGYLITVMYALLSNMVH